MSRQLEAQEEVRLEKRAKAIAKAVDYGLVGAVAHAGGVLTGFSVKLSEGDVLLTLRAHLPAGAQVAFVGSETLGGALLRAVKEGRSDNLRWRPDRFGT